MEMKNQEHVRLTVSLDYLQMDGDENKKEK